MLDMSEQIKAVQEELAQPGLSNVRYAELLQRLEWLKK